MNKQLKISVVIPAYNEAGSIEACLKSIRRQTRPADEIIVVNNNSTDATAAIAAQFARVVNEARQGIGPTRTRGFNEATGDIIVRIDADTVAEDTLLEVYETAFLEDEKLIAAAGKPLSRPALRHDIFRWIGHIPASLAWIDRELIKRITILYGFNFAMRKSAWDENRTAIVACDGVLNEDIEVSYILHNSGKTKYLPAAKVYFNLDDMSPLKLARYLVADVRSMWRYRRH